MNRLLPFLLALLVAACATPLSSPRPLPPRAELRAFALEARFSLTHDGERHSGRLSWRHDEFSDAVRIHSPFGQTVAELEFDAQRARLITADGVVHEAPTPEHLLREVLGYALPLDNLAGWILARPQNAAALERDAAARPRVLIESGWRILYEYDDESVGALPSRLFVVRDGGPELRLRIEEWLAP